MSKRIALVIGNALFPNAETLDNLRTPLEDAKSVATTLEEFGEFELAGSLLDENAASVKLKVEEFFKQAGRGDLALLYYSGHGFKDRTGSLYLAANDTDTQRPLNTAVAASFIKDAIQLSDCKHIVVVLDSCYSGTFQLGSKGESEDLPSFAKSLEGETVAVLASSRSGQVSFEGEGTYSRFTQVFLQGIRTARADKNLDGRITLQELFDYIRDNLSGQLPTLQLGNAGDDVYIARGIEQNLKTVYIASVKTDTYLHAWLAAKLRLAGHTIDTLPEFEEGQETNQLEQLSRTSAAFIPLISGKAIQNALFMKQVALGVDIHSRRPVVIPADVGGWYAEAFRLDPEVTCDFTGSWSEGYRQLIAQLKKLGVPTSNTPDGQEVLSHWKQAIGVRQSLQEGKAEDYRSNWFEIKLPENLYIHALNPYSVFDADDLAYPVVHHQDYLITFAAKECFSDKVEIWEDNKVKVDTFLEEAEYQIGDGAVVTSPNHKLIDLLNRILEAYLKAKKLTLYQQSSKLVFFFDTKKDGATLHKRVSLKSLGHNSMQLSGKTGILTWHYGLSGQAFLYPYPAYFLNAHLIFKENGNLINKKRQHKRRRKKGKDLYNKQWRNLMLAAMLELSEEESGLVIPTGGDTPIKIANQPSSFTSSIGYQEPIKTKEDSEDDDEFQGSDDFEEGDENDA